MKKKHQETGDRADTQLQENEEETPRSWGYS
jgi:hypothetical protein